MDAYTALEQGWYKYRLANVEVGKTQEASNLDREVQANKKCWEKEKYSFPGRIPQLIIQHQWSTLKTYT